MSSHTSITTAFRQFYEPAPFSSTPLRRAITAATRIPEPQAVASLVKDARLSWDQSTATQRLALRIAQQMRSRQSEAGRAGLVQNLLQEYSLSSQEGIALMCLAEALLRIPDSATRDSLIRDKISQGYWRAHLGQSPSLFVNAATWGLLITGKLVSTHSESTLAAAIGKLVNTGGEPLIRKAVDMAMRMMGEQFVTGETIEEALENGKKREAQGFRYSFDMLGEAAMTAQDAARYLRDYEAAIHAIGKASDGRGIHAGPGISIKLSALHPRYSRAQYDRVTAELYPVLVRLATLAKRYDIGLNIDAEEADRLEISLDLLERLAHEPQLRGWNGLGFVIQAYQKRCPLVIDYIIDLARRSSRRLMIRLVKGAYWDSEIKRAQVDGLAGYPVYTRKPYTDLSYIACARRLLAAPDAVFPQFATHNARTLATIYELARPATYTADQYEFQCLHGMGEPLYENVVGDVSAGKLGRPCRIYAPVGTHETLLAYLVRRLLENGANTSFVNRIADNTLTLEDLVRDPMQIVEDLAERERQMGLPHPSIPLPANLYGPTRTNSSGLDIPDEQTLQLLNAGLRDAATDEFHVTPMTAHDTQAGPSRPVINPSNNLDPIGSVQAATPEDIELALSAAQSHAQTWADLAPAERARLLRDAASILESRTPQLLSILMREAGKTTANAVAEVREAVDFLRYYAQQIGQGFDNGTHIALGPVVCISPWNFPLAIFMGQVAAALAAGNVVLAKPADQTPLIAAAGVQALWDAGIPRHAVQLMTGRGSVVGAPLVADPRTQGVLFTGSTEVARMLQRSVAGRMTKFGQAIPLIAETGGQNAMIVDSSALAEQVVTDVVASAFDSAGQRCSALRILCVQDDVADRLLEMLLGAMAELRIGNPDRLSTDIGPVIDANAKAGIDGHIASMRAAGKRVHQVSHRSEYPLHLGSFVIPTVIEIDRIDEVEREIFGPVLHFMRFRREDIEGVVSQINCTGYGLTLGLHTRIDETINMVCANAHVGNIYVNRNMVGAVVGVQPFGGEGLSGTGPKAGGPLYLHRLLARTSPRILSATIPAVAIGQLPENVTSDLLQVFTAWADSHAPHAAATAREFASSIWRAAELVLPGPTGERNSYRLIPRTAVLCLASTDQDRLIQLAAVLTVGSRAVWPADAERLHSALPAPVREQISLVNDWTARSAPFDAVLLHGSEAELRQVQQLLASMQGPVICVERYAPDDAAIAMERLVIERTTSVNTAAAGGNASLMALEA